MGGYVALEVMRQAPERVRALALLSTSARPDTPEQTAARREQIAMARSGRYDELVRAPSRWSSTRPTSRTTTGAPQWWQCPAKSSPRSSASSRRR
jgi:pimeloyl-ACP methyl ester carboxylesterase